MKEYITKKEYDEIIKEKERFKNLFQVLKIDSEEVIKEERKNNIITYFNLIRKQLEVKKEKNGAKVTK